MPRRRTKDTSLPPTVYRHGKRYRCIRGGRVVWSVDSLAEVYRRLAEEAVLPSSMRTVGDALSAYLLALQGQVRSRTLTDYQRQAGALREAFGHLALADVDAGLVQQYLTRRSSPTAANREVAVLSGCYQWAMRHGWASVNPCRGARRNRERARKRMPTRPELAALSATATEQQRHVLMLSLATGLRIGDVLALDVRQATEEGIELGISKTDDALRIVWSGALREAWKGLACGREIGPLVLSRLKRRYSDTGWQSVRQDWWRRAAEACPSVATLHWHDLRHWTITTVAEQRGKEAAKLLAAHASMATTERYLHLRAVAEVAALEVRLVG